MSAEVNRRTDLEPAPLALLGVPEGFPVASDYPEYLQKLRAIVDDELERRFCFSKACPKRLADAMRYSLLAPGKRLRPTLAMIAYEACGGSNLGDVASACVALEAVHAYSLIHDDLPAMDDDELRRGRPTCHRQFDEATAILAGDALLTFAFDVLSDETKNAEITLEAVKILADAAGATGMVGGQTDDVLWSSTLSRGVGARDLIGETLAVASEEKDDETPLVVDDPRTAGLSLFLKKIHRRKTGALFGAAAELGALFAKSNVRARVTLRRFGIELGLAFQIADDLLDVTGDEATLGKSVHKDAADDKLTFPSLYGVDATRKRLADVVARAKSMLLDVPDFKYRPRALNALFYLVDFAAGRDR